MKKWYESGTFYGALATGITGIGKIIIAVKSGDHGGIGEGLTIVFGAFTAWRLRKGVGNVG